jgi:Ras-related protein Rab-6A
MRKGLPPHETTKKVILLGNTGVGKTCLANWWMHNSFDPLAKPTIGASNAFREVEVGNRTVKVTLWDTAGQEQFRSITPLYVRHARCGIVVAAADSPESFEAVPMWLDLLKTTQEDPIPAIFAINKTDLVDTTSEEFTRLVDPYLEGFVSVFYVSAMTGDNVDSLFGESAKIADRSETESENHVHPEAENVPKKCC